MRINSKGLGTCARRLLEEMKEICSMDVILPVQNRNPVRLRIVEKSEPHVQVLLHALGLKVPNKPKIVKMQCRLFR